VKIIALALAAAPGLVPAAETSQSEKSPPPARAYVSAFEGYRPLIDEPMRPWRDVNDEVGRLGGDIGNIGKEAGTSARPASGNADTASPGDHSVHRR
jgi:hypothetical protein